jgi:hypothetical protein
MTAENVLGNEHRPRFFAVGNTAELDLPVAEPRYDVALRTYVRSLAGMQKEALVVSSATDLAWRLVSDEGPYLAGHDEAPFPLAFMAAGMVASYYTEATALAANRGAGLAGVHLTLDNHYTMEGSALRGTMVGGALPPQLRVRVDSPADRHGLFVDAVAASPMTALLRGQKTSLFTLTRNGQELPLGRVAPLGEIALPDAADRFDAATVGGPPADQLMVRGASAERHAGAGGVGSSLQAEQKRTLHVRAVCREGPEGGAQIDVRLFKPSGSTFRFRSEEATGRQIGRAPDAATLISAGIGFCFMTQFGRYASITKKRLDRYRIIQDTHFSASGAARPGQADPVETHVYLDTPEDVEFARSIVDMSEQTCFLHALCRTDLRTRLSVGSGQAPASAP